MESNQILSLSASQLNRAASIKEEIDRLTSELSNIFDGTSATSRVGITRGPGRPRKGGMSEAGRAKIAAAARARWARIKATGGAANLGGSAVAKKKRKMSAAGRAKIAAAARARWAKVRAEKKPA